MNTRERAQRRWFRFPIGVPKDAPFGEDVSMSALSAEEYEILAAIGPLTREELDVELRRRRPLDVDFSKYPAIGRLEQLVNRLPEEWYRALLEQEQEEADRFSRSRTERRPTAP